MRLVTPGRATLVLAIAAFAFPISAGAQQEETAEEFLTYAVEGPAGFNAPPVRLRIEGDRIVTPEGGVLPITDSEVTGDRVRFRAVADPIGPMRFLGVREGDAFAGYLFSESDQQGRWVVPVTFVPEGAEVDLAPDPAPFASAEGIARVEVVPDDVTLRANEPRRFVARAFGEEGEEITAPGVEWYRMSVDPVRATMDEDGTLRGFAEGDVRAVALVDGRIIAWADVHVLRPQIAEVHLRTDLPARLAVGSRQPLELDALDEVHEWHLDPEVEIVSSAPDVVTADGTALLARSPGTATVTIRADEATASFDVEVVTAEGAFSITAVPEDPVRTGDVVHLSTSIEGAVPVWAVAGGSGARIWPDGGFVAGQPGTHTIVATLGDRVARAEIEAIERGADGRIHIVGHGLSVERHTSDLWPQSGYVYVGTHQANQLRTYDVNDPANPVVVDTQAFDARVINDVKVSEDGAWMVATREGASDRRNGILVFSLEDPARPRLVSEYTETLTAGVHNVFWVGSLIYAVNDGTGDMHIVDLADPENPEEVGRWGLPNVGRSLHDVWIQDGIAYLSYLSDGLVILDIGGAGRGGTPTEPVQVSRIFYPGGPTHSAMRYGDYVFVGDEDFSLRGTYPDVIRYDPRGPIHVIDVSDLERPRYVGKYEVPEAGAHNFWIEDGVLYAGYYQGGLRVVDVSGELRGDLYAQGREIAHYLVAAGPDEAVKPYRPRTWGVFPMFTNGWGTIGDVLYATDYNSGLWTFTVEMPEEPIS